MSNDARRPVGSSAGQLVEAYNMEVLIKLERNGWI